MKDVNDVYTNPQTLARNPFLADSLLIGANGERIISKVTPSLSNNTLDQPIFPTTGHRYTLSTDLAGLGGNTNFYKPLVEAIWYMKQNARMSPGSKRRVRGHPRLVRGNEGALPIFERRFSRAGSTPSAASICAPIGPQDPITGVVLGGNKSVLFNIEQNLRSRVLGPPDPLLRRRPGARRAGLLAEGRPRRCEPARPAALVINLRVAITVSEDRNAASGVISDHRPPSKARSRPRPAPKSGSSCRCSTSRSG